MRRWMAAAAAVLAALTASACGGSAEESNTGRQASSTRGFNDADVRFATDMLPHHAQALSMVDLTHGKRLSPGVTALAEDIRMAQGPEIERMAALLRQWGKPVPATGRDHVGHHAGETDEHEMPGMASSDDLKELSRANGRSFERLFLTLMVEHHRGAITMAEDQLDSGENASARQLARSIATGQQQEIERMETMLADLR